MLDRIRDAYNRIQEKMQDSPFEGIKPIEDFSEQFQDEQGLNPYMEYLEPSEIAEAKREAMRESERIQNSFLNRGKEDPGKISGMARHMFDEAMTQYAYIYSMTAKIVAAEREEIEREKERLSAGESKKWDYSYTDMHGNEVRQELGLEKDPDGNVKYYRETGEEDRRKRTYISETAFFSCISECARNELKQERGLTEALYVIEDKEGNRIMITDARDDDAEQNSFNDGYAAINIYRVGADGSREQLTGKELSLYVRELGLTERQIRNRDAAEKIFRSFAELRGNIAREMMRQAVRSPGKVLEDMKREAAEASL